VTSETPKSVRHVRSAAPPGVGAPGDAMKTRISVRRLTGRVLALAWSCPRGRRRGGCAFSGATAPGEVRKKRTHASNTHTHTPTQLPSSHVPLCPGVPADRPAHVAAHDGSRVGRSSEYRTESETRRPHTGHQDHRGPERCSHNTRRLTWLIHTPAPLHPHGLTHDEWSIEAAAACRLRKVPGECLSASEPISFVEEGRLVVGIRHQISVGSLTGGLQPGLRVAVPS